jgi:hypothetical protein
MFKHIIFLGLIVFISKTSFSQGVAIGTPTPQVSAILELVSSNKALLLPRLADTASITTAKVEGLLMYCKADSNIYYYNGNHWTQVGNESLWKKINDSSITTTHKHTGVNENPKSEAFLNTNLNVVGTMRVGLDYSKRIDVQPTSVVMNNTSALQFLTDTVIYIYDPGGTGNYINNTQGNIVIPISVANEIITITSDTIFDLGTGDTLWLSSSSFINDYRDRFYSGKPLKEYLSDDAVFIIFKANGNNVNGSGFKLKVERHKLNLSQVDQEKASLINEATGLRYDAYHSNLITGRSKILRNSLGCNALGANVITAGDYCTAIGVYNYITGTNCNGLGTNNYLTGYDNTAIGRANQLFNNNGIALGSANKINAEYCFALGHKNVVNKDYSFALGYYNTTDTVNAYCLGAYLSNPFPQCLVVGASNKSTYPQWPTVPPRFIVGAGGQQNALLTNANGFTGFNKIDDPLAAVHANGKIITDNVGLSNSLSALEWRNAGNYKGGFGWDQTAGRFFFFDGESGTNTFFVNNGRFGIQRDATTNALEVNGNASKSSAGDWLANSDARLKKEIRPLSSSLDKLLKLRGVSYQWADSVTGVSRPKGIQYGFTAQNIQTIFPELVETDAQGFLQTSYGTYDALTVEAIRELKQQIDDLRKELNDIKAAKK